MTTLAGRVREVAPPEETDSRALAAVAEAWAAFHQGQRSAMKHQLERRRDDLAAASTPVPRILREHLLALSSALDGFQPDACRRLLALADEAAEIGFAVGECRALARLCMASFIAGAPRMELLEIAGRYDKVRDASRLQPGFSDLLVGAAHAEALHGLGRYEDAAAAVQSVQALSLRVDWPAADILLVQTRLAFHREGLDGVRRMTQAFEGRWQSLGRPSIDACVRYLQALRGQNEGDLTLSAQRFTQAHDLARATGVRPWLELMSISLALVSWTFEGAFERAEMTLRQLERSLERTPSPWFSAFRAHLVGLLRSAQGRELEARQSMEAAIATLELCGEVTEAARVRRSLAVVATVLGAEDADRLFEQTDAELKELGITPTALHTRDGARQLARRRNTRDLPGSDARLSPLVVGVQRLSVRGLAPAALLGELLGLVRATVGETVKADGVATDKRAPLVGETVSLRELDAGPTAMPEAVTAVAATHALEFGDGCGRRYRLSLPATLQPGQSAAIRLLASTAALALEVNALRALADPKARPAPPSTRDLPDFIAASDVMRAVIGDVQRLGRSRATVLIDGESGSGKEGIARAVHDLSARSSGPYVTLNCTAVPRELFESQLFGHRKGAFTGADRSAPGVIRAAEGGTVFLDEIGELPLDVQAKLLRFLENREVQPVGEPQPRRVDVRVVAATHRDLPGMVTAGTFRKDLLYRLQVVALHLPPLRARRDDILPLARVLLGEAAIRMARQISNLSPAVADQLLRYEWPGNVRELENAMERAVALARGSRVELEDLPEEIRQAFPKPVISGAAVQPLRDVEKEYILAVLERNGGNQTHTAKQLGIGSATLYRKLKKYGLIRDRSSGSKPAPGSG